MKRKNNIFAKPHIRKRGWFKTSLPYHTAMLILDYSTSY